MVLPPSLVYLLLLGTSLLATCVSLVGAALNVDIPDDFFQCEKAVVGLRGVRGNVSVVVREKGEKKAHLNVSLPSNATEWDWPLVDLPAGTDFLLVISDRTPGNKTKLSQSISHSTVDLAPTGVNDTSCLPAPKDTDKHKGHKSDPDDGSDLGIGDEMPDGPPHKKHSTVEVSVIAGVLGGLLFALMLLILIMCLRRRKETHIPQEDNNSIIGGGAVESTNEDEMIQRRSDYPSGLSGDQYVVLADGSHRRLRSIVTARQEDAGWSYMASVVPGLQASNRPPSERGHGSSGNVNNRSSRTNWRTKRYDNEGHDGELPSYGLSEYERKHLPKYEAPTEGESATEADRRNTIPELLSHEPSTHTERRQHISHASSSGSPFIYDLDEPSRQSPLDDASDIGVAYLRRDEHDEEEDGPDVITFHATPSANSMGPTEPMERSSLLRAHIRSYLTQDSSRLPSHQEYGSPGSTTALDAPNGEVHRRTRSEVSHVDGSLEQEEGRGG